MKKFLALLLALAMGLALSACGNTGDPSGSGRNPGTTQGGNNKPSAKFSGTYQYNPPKDNYYIKWQSYDASGQPDDSATIYARIGGGCTYAEEGGGVYHASDEQQKYYERAWEGEYSEWMLSPGYSYEDWKADRDEFGDDLGSCDAFGDTEFGFMRYYKAYGFDEDEGKLAEYYVGTEKVAGVECWVFDSKGLNTIQQKYWVDPANGCCLKVLDKEDGEYAEVTEYNLNYTEWTDNLAPSSYEGIE